jgi:hypothetical protein
VQRPAAPAEKIIYGSNSKAGSYFDKHSFKMFYETNEAGTPLLCGTGNFEKTFAAHGTGLNY